MITIGAPKYINTLPLFLALQNGSVPFNATYTFDVPTRINERLLAGKLDIGLISSACFLKNENTLSCITSFGIGAKEKVMSVMLFTRHPPHLLDGKKIAVTRESETSSLLLQVLAHHFWHITPTYVPLEETHELPDAFLLIGDKALVFQHPEYFAIDLAKEWFYHTTTPFTFALFASSKKMYEPKLEEALEQALSQALTWSQQNETHIVDEAAKRTGRNKEELYDYFCHLSFVRTNAHQQGLQLFSRLAKPFMTPKSTTL
jgi:chorismate dehydratase